MRSDPPAKATNFVEIVLSFLSPPPPFVDFGNREKGKGRRRRTGACLQVLFPAILARHAIILPLTGQPG
jgi:hypothetical protein